jgi:hypothetical protein
VNGYEILCANTPQAKGCVERMNLTLQDRLVKELRLRGISSWAAGNEYLPVFIDDYNRRFSQAPSNTHDAHRPLRGDEDLDHLFAWQEERQMTRNLTVHFKRRAYLVQPTAETLAFGGRRVLVRQWEDGRVELHCAGRILPHRVLDKDPLVNGAEVIENKRLGAVLAVIQAAQATRDEVRLASRKLPLREKARLREARAQQEEAPRAD